MGEDHSKSLINLGDLSKPANTLVKKISDAVGGLFAPHQIKRIAKAEADAAMISAESEIQITELHRRAMRRFVEEEAARQQNMEDITERSFQDLHENADPSQMDDDWVSNFFDKSRLISDEDMQALWSKVLSSEANTPGQYSKRTVNLLADLDKSDAQLFAQLCGFGWQIAQVVPLVFDVSNEIYTRQGINFIALSHLETLGLVQFNNISGFKQFNLPDSFAVSYYGRRLELKIPEYSENEIDLGHVLLTKTGQELATVCGSAPVDGFFEFVKEHWSQLVKK